VHAITWIKERGAEFAEVSLGATYLRAAGVAVGAAPRPYRLDYELDCADGFVTRRLLARTQGAGWSRRLLLSRDPMGSWGIEASVEGEADLPEPGGDPTAFAKALDCDLGECPLTNTMPVLRHGLLDGGMPHDFVMAWVGVPDLSVRASPQRCSFVGPLATSAGQEDGTAVIRFESGDFAADVVFDSDGLVVDDPGLARRA
jgi:hypothetical protein